MNERLIDHYLLQQGMDEDEIDAYKSRMAEDAYDREQDMEAEQHECQ